MRVEHVDDQNYTGRRSQVNGIWINGTRSRSSAETTSEQTQVEASQFPRSNEQPPARQHQQPKGDGNSSI
jgi:hypothetical protein